jgi:hypothetical protein
VKEKYLEFRTENKKRVDNNLKEPRDPSMKCKDKHRVRTSFGCEAVMACTSSMHLGCSIWIISSTVSDADMIGSEALRPLIGSALFRL